MSWMMAEYLCPTHGRFESLEQRPAPERKGCPVCKVSWPLVVSAPKTKTVWASAETHGGRESAPVPTATTTTSMGEGQSFKEWKAERRKVWRERDFKKRREKGLR